MIHTKVWSSESSYIWCVTQLVLFSKGWGKRTCIFKFSEKETTKGTCPNMFWLYSLLASFAGSISEPPFKSNSTVSNALSRFTVYWHGDYFENIKKYSSQKLVKKNIIHVKQKIMNSKRKTQNTWTAWNSGLPLETPSYH